VNGTGSDATGRELVLYRCPTPTNVLCPCGAVARQLRRLGIPHRVERVPYRRSQRPEIVELTGQSRVPLLIDGEEIVHDSKRIREYLEWRYPDGPAVRGTSDDGRSTASG
jgi:glutathione S-transferase